MEKEERIGDNAVQGLEPVMTIDQGTVTPQENHHRREFKARHVSMIAVAAAIGTGLIIGSGTALVRGGPTNLLIAYCLVGDVVFFGQECS